MTFYQFVHDKDDAIKLAHEVAMRRDEAMYVVLDNDGTYHVADTKPLLGNINGTREVILVGTDGRSFHA